MRTAYPLITTDLHRSQQPARSARRYSRYAAEILNFLVQHRTAIAGHVQRRFPELFHTDRATRMHLQTLVAHGDLDVLGSRGLGQPNVYVLTQRGLRKLARRSGDTAAEDGLPRRRRPTGSHLVHELLITEFAVSVAEAIRARPDLAIHWEERFGFVKHPTFQNLIPDYGFLFQHPQGLLTCFIEVFSGEESTTRIGQKLQAYTEWAASTEAQEFLIDLYRQRGAREPRPQFRLLLIAHERRARHDHTRLRQILRETLVLPRMMRERIWGATVSDLATAHSIDAPVWVRARDLRPPGTDLETLSPRERRRVLTSVLLALVRHRLFPAPEDTTHVATAKDQSDSLAHPPRNHRPVGG